MTLPRGFKTGAEREAVKVRQELGLSGSDRLDVHQLAEHLDIKIVSADALVSRDRLEEIERLQAFAFSAATFHIGNRCYVVTNPVRTASRQASDISHEIAHMMLKHELTEIREINGTPFRTCRPNEEEQATAFGGTLMLPRPLLLAAARRQMGPTEIAATFGVTEEMARYRYNSTGVAKQIRASSR
jgi:Zn-dependent peptidase ImmA (M78 family)